MAKFTTRVELHDAKVWEDYEKLHVAMEKEGFTRTIESRDVSYRLPTAEYNREGSLTKEAVLNLAKKAAARAGHTFSILVTKSNGRTWYNLPEA